MLPMHDAISNKWKHPKNRYDCDDLDRREMCCCHCTHARMDSEVRCLGMILREDCKNTATSERA